MRRQRSRFQFWGLLLSLASLITGMPAAAQLRSPGAGVTLVAILHDSVRVQYQFVPRAWSFAQDDAAPLEVLHVFLQWRLRPGQSVQIQSTLDTEHQTRSLLSPSGFVSIRQLTAASSAFAFQLPSATPAVVLGAESEEAPVGRASFLIGLARPNQADGYTIRIAIAVL